MVDKSVVRELVRSAYRDALRALPYNLRQRADYLRREGRVPNVGVPQRHSERLLHRIMFERSALLTSLCSKDWVKHQAREIIADKNLRIAETYWRGPGEELKTAVAERCASRAAWVAKPNNLGGGLIFRPAADSRQDVDHLSSFIRQSKLTEEIYRDFAPVAWRGSEGGFLLEERIGGEEGIDDFKVHVFNGVPRVISAYSDRLEGRLQVRHYDRDFQLLYTRNAADAELPIPRGVAQEMMAYAGPLALGLPYARVDFYWSHDAIWLGEISPFGSMDGLRHNSQLDHSMGSWWDSTHQDRR